MTLIEIAPEVFVNPYDVVSVEHDIITRDFGGWSNSDMRQTFNGTRITLRNGRKVFVDKIMPTTILQIIKEKTK